MIECKDKNGVQIKVGDKILGTPHLWEGWPGWAEQMHDLIGKELTVTEIDEIDWPTKQTFVVAAAESGKDWTYPSKFIEVLKEVNEKPTKSVKISKTLDLPARWAVYSKDGDRFLSTFKTRLQARNFKRNHRSHTGNKCYIVKMVAIEKVT